jgi:VanZ family protein
MKRRDGLGRDQRAFLHWVPPLAWMLLIFLLSAQSRLPKPAHPLLDQLVQGGAHLLLYGVLLALVWNATRKTCPDSRTMLWSMLLTLAYALSDEYHQTRVPERHGTFVDLGIDIAGILLAAGLIALGRRRNHPEGRLR